MKTMIRLTLAAALPLLVACNQSSDEGSAAGTASEAEREVSEQTGTTMDSLGGEARSMAEDAAAQAEEEARRRAEEAEAAARSAAEEAAASAQAAGQEAMENATEEAEGHMPDLN